MRAAAIIIILATFVLLNGTSASGKGVEVKDVTMRLEEGGAVFEINYTLDAFTRAYVLALGCRHLEPELVSFLGGYGDVELIGANENGAALRVHGAGVDLDNCYLFDSRPFGTKDKPLEKGVDKLSVIFPEGEIQTFYNVTSTENVFCKKK